MRYGKLEKGIFELENSQKVKEPLKYKTKEAKLPYSNIFFATSHRSLKTIGEQTARKVGFRDLRKAVGQSLNYLSP